MENQVKEMVTYNIDILGLVEVKWTDEEVLTEKYKMVYIGVTKMEHTVRFIFKKQLDKNISKIVPKSDRVIAMKNKGEPVDTFLIQVYNAHFRSQ